MASASFSTPSTIGALVSIALTCACSSKNDAADSGAPDAAIVGDDDAAAEVDSGDRDGDADAAVVCAPRDVLSSDTMQLTRLGDTKPLWVPASVDDTIVAYASDTTSAVVIDELPANPAHFAIVNVPFDRSPARRLTIEAYSVTSPQIADRTAYWMLDAPSAPALRSIPLDGAGDAAAPVARTVTTFADEPIPERWLVDGDAAYWIYDRPDPNVPANPGYAVLMHAALADGAHVEGPTLAPGLGPPPGLGGEPYAFAAADVKAGYVYFALITQLGNPPVTSAFSVKREPASGGTIEALGEMQTGFAQLFVTERFVYWVADLSTHTQNASVAIYDFAIYQSGHDGTGTRKIAGHDGLSDLNGIPYVHVEGNVLYWFDGPTQIAKYLRAFCE